MPRYKTVGSMRCENGHVNLFDIRIRADSPDVARISALGEALLRGCHYCKTIQPLTLGQVFSTQEMARQIESTIWGYTCHCGEKVEVARFEPEQVLTFPGSKTVSCPNGHSRSILSQELPLLERWEEINS
jgi:hypothetical protein